ncbi:MAG: 30S ribosomal protein S9 [Omnitrophica bacterium RIFCSPLOWO2_01_FULL_45_10b]|nr:MAG: 30S ribosomal protein S9 [Omnitrophica bacterium RIFCSPLOWO2_01_FULL_45_10b]
MVEAEIKTNSFYGLGRRKSAIARVWLADGGKEIVVNSKTQETYFPRETLRMIIQQPLEAAKLMDRFAIRAEVCGGGLTGQAEAVRLGISRALLEFDPNLRSLLRKGGFLTRDPRKKERKKYGHKGARRSFQYTKR